MLADSQRRGFLGPGPIEGQLERSLHLGAGIPPAVGEETTLMDLGSGGGLPGIPLAVAFEGTRWILLDGGAGRASFLTEAVERLGLAHRVTVVAQRAEEAGRGPLRGTLDVVVARSFGPPAVTAECAAPFLKTQGILLVAEPPGQLIAGRWDVDGLASLGLTLATRSEEGTSWQSLVQSVPCPDRYPRRTGIPNKRPLF